MYGGDVEHKKPMDDQPMLSLLEEEKWHAVWVVSLGIVCEWYLLSYVLIRNG